MNKQGDFINLPKLYCMTEYADLLEKAQEDKQNKGIKESEIIKEQEEKVLISNATVFPKTFNPFE